jgi:hypothetical protein
MGKAKLSAGFERATKNTIMNSDSRWFRERDAINGRIFSV